MELKKIKPGRWYETTVGIGECLEAGGTHPPSVKMRILYPFPRGNVYCTPRQILKEVLEPTAPKSAGEEE